MPLGFIAPKIIWLSNLSKRVVSTKLGIYVFKLFCKTNINHKIYMHSLFWIGAKLLK
jgi:hypothetical protein